MENDWHSYEFQRPPSGVLCVFERRHWTPQSPEFPQITQTFVGTRDEFNPAFNIADLYWKFTGIGREYVESLPEITRAQIMPPTQISYGQCINSAGWLNRSS